MTLEDCLEAIEPGGPPYGVMYGSSIKFEDIMQCIPDLLEQNPDLNVLMSNGDIVQGLTQKPEHP